MADPLSVIASITGLIMAGIQITSTVGRFISSTTGAPVLAQTISSEVHDFVRVLSSLQHIVLGPLGSVARTSMIDVDDLIITITACICTLSDLEKEVDCLAVNDNMSIRARLKWAWAETTILGLIARVQHHKSSLNLMLTILTWYVSLNCALYSPGSGENRRWDSEYKVSNYHNSEATAEATNSMQSLRILVEQMSEQLGQIALFGAQNTAGRFSHNPERHSNGLDSSAVSILTTDQTQSILQSSAASMMTVRNSYGSTYASGSGDTIRSMSSFNFESTLLNTRLYSKALYKPWMSSAHAGGWSVLSGRSLAEVSNISVLELPLVAGALANPWWYDGSISEEEFLACLPEGILDGISWGIMGNGGESRNSGEFFTTYARQEPVLSPPAKQSQWSRLVQASAVAYELDSLPIERIRYHGPPRVDEFCYRETSAGESPFILAILDGNVAALKIYLNKGADARCFG